MEAETITFLLEMPVCLPSNERTTDSAESRVVKKETVISSLSIILIRCTDSA